MNKVAIGVIFGALGLVGGGISGYFIGKKAANSGSEKKAKRKPKDKKDCEVFTFADFKKAEKEEKEKAELEAEDKKAEKEEKEKAKVVEEEKKPTSGRYPWGEKKEEEVDGSAPFEPDPELEDEEEDEDVTEYKNQVSKYKEVEEPRKPVPKTQKKIEEGLKKNSKKPAHVNRTNYYDPMLGIYQITKREFNDETKIYQDVSGTYYPDTNRLELYSECPPEPLDGEAVEKAIGSIDLKDAFEEADRVYIRNEVNGIDYEIDEANCPDPYEYDE